MRPHKRSTERLIYITNYDIYDALLFRFREAALDVRS